MIFAIQGLMVPFLGTALGAAAVFFQRERPNPGMDRGLRGFAAGVMVAASVWSLLLPALETGGIFPAVAGTWAGMLFFRLLDRIAPEGGTEGGRMALAVTIHNLPEGMAVGVVYGGLLSGRAGVTALGAMSLAVGIAVQNLPEGAIVSMPLRAGGMGKNQAFLCGAASGAVEPLGGMLAMLASALAAPVMPWLLGFAAGAMVTVVIEELIPGMQKGPAGIYCFTLGFTMMMALDVVLG